MIIGKKEQERLEREQCAQISLLCRQKLMGYAESFEELGKSFRQEIQITGEDRQNILEKCMLWQSRQIMGDHLQERVAGEELGYCPLEEKKRKSLVQALKSEGIIARDLCYVEKDGSSSGTEAGISMTLSTEKRHYKAAQVADMLTVLLGKKLQVSSGSPYLVEQEPHCFLFTEEPKYIALTGVSRAVKEGEKVSGDQYATMESEKGKLILLLSDGTGSGEDASRGSGRVMDLMEKMLEAGFGTEASVNLLNSALYAQNEEDDHPTIDLCSLDLYTGECEICKGIDSGAVMDIIEMDAASNNGVDDIRDLRDEVAYLPSVCKYKVYIIDEVHMLSTAAFNALLKTMEEPPEHVIFILATTEVQKVPVTILSRCQRYDFTRITADDISKRLLYVAGQEKIDLDENAAQLIGRLADGAMRDALSILDTCAGVDNKVDEALVRRMAGVTDRGYLFEISDAIAAGDSVAALEKIAALRQQSVDMRRLCIELAGHYRNLMLSALPGGTALLAGISPEEEAAYNQRQFPAGRCHPRHQRLRLRT